MFKKMKSKKFKVAVVVLLCTLAVSTTAVAASFQLLNFNDTKYKTVKNAVSDGGAVAKAIDAAKTKISDLQKAVTARSNERDDVQTKANSTMSSVNADIDTTASTAAALEDKATELQTTVNTDNSDVSSQSSVTYVDTIDK